MASRDRRASLADAIRNTTPAPRALDREPVRVATPASDRELPVVVEADAGVDACRWALEHRARIQGWLRDHGAVLLRGFPVSTAEVFGRLADGIAGPRVAYANRSSPRTTVGDRIYTSTDYPSHLPIFPHNEHGYSPVFPLYLFFCCLEPARTGGATPIGSTRAVGDRIPAAIRRRFREKRVMYVRNFHEGFGVPWQESFQTTDRAEVERYCAAHGIRCEWRERGMLRTRRVGPAEIAHPITGETVWFNHATFYHASTLPVAIRDELLASFDEDELPNQTYYGDGTPIEEDVVAELRAAYERAMRPSAWRRGDVLAVDNVLAVHAREPFTGPRRVLVSMAETVSLR